MWFTIICDVGLFLKNFLENTNLKCRLNKRITANVIGIVVLKTLEIICKVLWTVFEELIMRLKFISENLFLD